MRQQRGALRLLFEQHTFLLVLFLCDFAQFFAGIVDVGPVVFDGLEVGAQCLDQFGLCLRDVTHVLQVAVDAVRIIAGEQQLDAVRIAGHIFLTDQLGHLCLLRIDALFEVDVLFLQALAFLFGLLLFFRQFA